MFRHLIDFLAYLMIGAAMALGFLSLLHNRSDSVDALVFIVLSMVCYAYFAIRFVTLRDKVEPNVNQTIIGSGEKNE